MPEITSFPRQVLVVDDEDLVLEILGVVFESVGIEVRTATRGDQAVELLRTSGFGCLLTDKNLPGLDGIEVIRVARREQPWCACILMTAYASAGSAIEALRLGAIDYLEKPFPDFDQLAARVANVLDEGQAAFERERFLRGLRAGEQPAAEKQPPGARPRSEVELFERAIESRVARATEELRCRCERLEARLRQAQALQASAEALLRHARAAGDDPRRGLAPDALDGLARALELQVCAEPGLDAAPHH